MSLRIKQSVWHVTFVKYLAITTLGSKGSVFKGVSKRDKRIA